MSSREGFTEFLVRLLAESTIVPVDRIWLLSDGTSEWSGDPFVIVAPEAEVYSGHELNGIDRTTQDVAIGYVGTGWSAVSQKARLLRDLIRSDVRRFGGFLSIQVHSLEVSNLEGDGVPVNSFYGVVSSTVSYKTV